MCSSETRLAPASRFLFVIEHKEYPAAGARVPKNLMLRVGISVLRRFMESPRHNPSLQVTENRGNAPEPVSSISKDEEARLLNLADTALQNEHPTELRAGDRTRQEHHRLIQELQDSVDRLDTDEPAA